jgi:hypothetical protein
MFAIYATISLPLLRISIVKNAMEDFTLAGFYDQHPRMTEYLGGLTMLWRRKSQEVLGIC